MPTKLDIQQEVLNLVASSSVDTIRRKHLQALHEHTKNDTIILFSCFASKPAPPASLMITLEDVQAFMSALYGLKGEKLDLILHTPGGYLEPGEQIINYLRAKYKVIRAIVPSNAMSTGTIMACACDEIIMGKHSALGPIDPQMVVNTPMGPAQSPADTILKEFADIKNEIIQNPNLAVLWVAKVQSYPHGFLKICEETIARSKNVAEAWLKDYMFHNDPDKDKKSSTISNWLGNFESHKSHGRPLNAEMLKEKGLNVSRLEDDQALQEKVLSVFHASSVTVEMTNCSKFVENHEGRGLFTQVSAPMK